MNDATVKSDKKKGGGFGETVRTIIYAVLIALGIRVFLYEPFNIPSGSMIPTLLVGDYLFVSKFSYGYSRYTVAFGAPVFDGRILFREPERGDVAVFKLPTDTSQDYIKRVIGLPGDRVQVREGRLFINGDEVPRQAVDAFRAGSQDGPNVDVDQFQETLPGGASYNVLEITTGGFVNNTGVFEVPEDHYFMMGDNRDRSVDSRSLDRVGFVPVENLVGRAEIIFMSLDDNTRFWELWRWPQNLRYDRLLMRIE